MIRKLNEAFDKLNNTNIKSNKTILESLQEAEEFEESYSDIEQVKSFLKPLIVNGRVRALRDDEKLPRGVYFKSGTGHNGVIHFKGNDYAYALVKDELRVMPEEEAGWNWSETIYSDDSGKLEEKLPSDLAKAYDRNNLYKNRSGRYSFNDTDYEKAEYREITPEEAAELRKQGRIADIRAIVNGDLVRYDSEGRPIANTEVKWDDRYTTKTGTQVDNTRKMPFNYIMQIADKIYVTDEATSKIGDDKLKRRDEIDDYYFVGGTNPDSYWGSAHFGDTVKATGAEDTGRHLTGYDKKGYEYKRYLDYAKEYKERLGKLQAQYDAGDISRNEYEARKTSLQREYDDYMQDAYREKPTRNPNSPLTVAYNKRNLNKYKALKYTVQQSLKDIDKENNKLQDLKTSNADSSEYKYERDQLAKLRAQLKSIQSEIEYYEGKLSDDSIAKDTKATEAELDRLTKRQADAQKQLDDLLKR